MSRSLTDNLRESVERDPDAVAIVHQDRRMTYADLWREVAALAGFLRASGLEPGERVALLCENSPEYAAGYYGTLAAGGVVVALNTAARARDLTVWLRHSQARWLIAEAASPELSSVRRELDPGVRLILVGEGAAGDPLFATWAEVASARAGVVGPVWDASGAHEAPAAIIYTSGTTGRPKGVTLSHQNLASNVESILAYLRLTRADRSLNVLPFYYSYGNSVLHTHLAAGATLVLENSLAYLHNVLARIPAEGITGFYGVPSTYALMLTRAQLSRYDLTSLRYVAQAGGPMSPGHIQRLRAALPQSRIFVMYGQTEATARLTYLPPERLEEKLGSAGIAIPKVTLEIRDERGTVLPPGQVGEIWARGPNVMLGYWNDPAGTAEALQNGWLRTGDLAYMDDEGYVYIQGRATEMIKSGAHRINPRDIEEAIGELEEVAEVAVVGVPDEILGQVIKAVIVLRPGARLDPLTVKAHCQSRIASFKIPKQVEFTTQLPKTASGKVKRFLLVNAAMAEH